MRRACALSAALLVLAASIAGCGGSAPAQQTYLGQALGLAEKPAPEIALRDSDGRPVRLSRFRGRAVLLSFLYTRCPDVCPLQAAKLAAALDRLGPQARRAQLVAVSVDPQGDTPARVRRFLRMHDLTGRMRYLVGTQRELAPAWRAYGVGVRGAPGSADVAHSSTLYGITAGGKEAVVYSQDFPVGAIVHDVPRLASR